AARGPAWPAAGAAAVGRPRRAGRAERRDGAAAGRGRRAHPHAGLSRRAAQLHRGDGRLRQGARRHRPRRRMAAPPPAAAHPARTTRMMPMPRRILTICLTLLAGLPALAAAGTAPELPTPEKIMALRSVGDPQIDRDGQWIAYTVGTPQAQGQPPRSRIWRVPATGRAGARELPAPAAASDEHPRWTADGRHLDFISNRPLPAAEAEAGLAGTQVWRVDARGDDATLLTHAQGDVSAFEV